jgi:hypothetical protein
MAVLKGEEPTQAFPWTREVKSSSPNIACQRALPVTQRSSSWPADDTSSTAAELIFDIDIVDVRLPVILPAPFAAPVPT